jgi:hypothetical protein
MARRRRVLPARVRLSGNKRDAAIVVAEAEKAFEEDPCVPDVRHTLDHTRERLADLHESVRGFVGPFELPEPSEETLANVRALYERVGKRWRPTAACSAAGSRSALIEPVCCLGRVLYDFP